jgi:hypothetical protein
MTSIGSQRGGGGYRTQRHCNGLGCSSECSHNLEQVQRPLRLCRSSDRTVYYVKMGVRIVDYGHLYKDQHKHYFELSCNQTLLIPPKT